MVVSRGRNSRIDSNPAQYLTHFPLSFIRFLIPRRLSSSASNPNLPVRKLMAHEGCRQNASFGHFSSNWKRLVVQAILLRIEIVCPTRRTARTAAWPLGLKSPGQLRPYHGRHAFARCPHFGISSERLKRIKNGLARRGVTVRTSLHLDGLAAPFLPLWLQVVGLVGLFV
jgi:hypothetical protein